MVYIFSSFMVISSFLQTLHRMQNRITSNTLYLTLFCETAPYFAWMEALPLFTMYISTALIYF